MVRSHVVTRAVQKDAVLRIRAWPQKQHRVWHIIYMFRNSGSSTEHMVAGVRVTSKMR